MAERSAAADGTTWLEAVERIVAAVGATDVAELHLASDDFLLRVHRRVGAATALPAAVAPGGEHDESHLHAVVAPLTGVFYRSPSPTAKPYVGSGDWVDAETVVGLIETMTIFNEVTADRSGRVVRVLPENGQLVHAGETLVTLEPGLRASADFDQAPTV